MNNYDVFISYSHVDKQIADAICHRFEEDKLKCWIAPRDIAPGTNWAEAIADVIPECKVFFLIFSSHSNMSKQVLREVELAVSNGLTILPVRIEDIKPSSGMAYYLSTVHWIDAIDKDIDSKLHSLSKTVANTLKYGTQPIPGGHTITKMPKAKGYKSRRSLTWLWILIAVIAVAVVVGGFLYLNSKISSNQTMPVDIVQEDTTYNVLLDLEFENKEDARWVNISGENAESIVGEDCIENGVFTLKGQIDMKQSLAMGDFIHLRVTTPDFDKDGSMFMLDFGKSNFDYQEELHNIRFYFSNNQTPAFDVSEGNKFAHVDQSYTPMMIESNMKLDVIVWLNESDNSLRYFVSDADNSENIGTMGVELSGDWSGDNWACTLSIDDNFWNGEVSAEQLYTDIEFIKVASGSLKTYFDENLGTYAQNKDRIDEFLSKSMTAISDLNFISNGEEMEEETSLPTETQESSKYNVLLDLEFDDEEDYDWVFHHAASEDMCEFKDGKIYLHNGAVNIDYTPNPGSIIHYKAILSPNSAIDLSGYRVNSDITFESIYYEEDQGKSTGSLSMEGLPFKNNEQYIDFVMYINADKSAAYAIAIDEEGEKIAYYACQIPEEKKDVPLYSSLEKFGEGTPIIAESITIAGGSLQAYLNDNFETYRQNQNLVDEFLNRGIEELAEPEIKFS